MSATSSGSEDELMPLGNLLDEEFNSKLHMFSSMLSNRQFSLISMGEADEMIRNDGASDNLEG